MAATYRSSTLAGFMNLTTCEDVTAKLGGVTGMQIPYYITECGGLYYVRLIGQASGYRAIRDAYLPRMHSEIFRS